MRLIKRSGFIATALVGIFLGMAPANAVVVVNWTNFGNNTTSPSPTTFSATGSDSLTYSIAASAFNNTTAWAAEAMYGKNLGGLETGLGIASDPSGNHEIWSTHFIQIDTKPATDNGLKSFSFTMGSTTQLEAWDVYGSNSTGSGAVLHLLYQAGSDQGLSHNIAGYRYFDFFYDPVLDVPNGNDAGSNDNVLLHTFSGNSLPSAVTPDVPEPSTWAMMILGFLGIGFIAYRRQSRPSFRFA